MLEVNFKPFPVFNSERLLFRLPTVTDAAQVFRLRTEPETMKYLDKHPMKNEEEALALINNMLSSIDKNEGITWAIALPSNPELLIGTIGFWRIEKFHYRAEIGYMLLPEYFNKGYMTEAIRRVADFGFNEMNLHSIEANINPANAASAAILLKTGFVKEAYFKENYFFDGRFIDSEIYSLLRSQPHASL